MNTSIMTMTVIRALGLLLCAASVLPAQSSRERERERERQRERDIERRAEKIGKTVEKTVEASIEGAMRSVESALSGIDRHYEQGYDSRQGGARLDTTFAFSDGTVDLTSFNGDIIVTGWDRNQARVRASTERGSLDSATINTVEKSLIAIDKAIADARRALAGDASSQFLTEQLNWALEKKLGVLRRVALLPVRAS